MKIVSLKNLPTTTTAHDAAGIKQQMIKDGQINHLRQFSQVTFKPGEMAKEHQHTDFYEVFLVENGEGTMKVNGKIYHLEKGICLTIEPGELHEVVNNGSQSLTLTYFGIYKN